MSPMADGTPMPTDEEAARIMTRAVTNENCRGLPGTDKCTHILSGAGFSASEVGDERWRRHWQKSPYRHHVYTWDPANTKQQCKCGHAEQARIHQTCWQDGWKDRAATGGSKIEEMIRREL